MYVSGGVKFGVYILPSNAVNTLSLLLTATTSPGHTIFVGPSQGFLKT